MTSRRMEYDEIQGISNRKFSRSSRRSIKSAAGFFNNQQSPIIPPLAPQQKNPRANKRGTKTQTHHPKRTAQRITSRCRRWSPF